MQRKLDTLFYSSLHQLISSESTKRFHLFIVLSPLLLCRSVLSDRVIVRDISERAAVKSSTELRLCLCRMDQPSMVPISHAFLAALLTSGFLLTPVLHLPNFTKIFWVFHYGCKDIINSAGFSAVKGHQQG